MMGIPMVLAWAFVLPMILYYKVTKLIKVKKNTWFIKRIKYGFLTGGFKAKYYYWEFVRMYEKILIVIVNNIFSSDMNYKLIITGLIIFTY